MPAAVQTIVKSLRLLLIFSLLSTIIACEGDDGSDGIDGTNGTDGATGTPGTPGTPAVSPASPIPTSLAGDLTDITISEDGMVTANFELQNELGQGYVGLPSGQIRFTLVQLFPIDAVSGDTSRWQSYINRVETAATYPDAPGTEDKVQATSEREGTLTDNGDGSYSYLFDVNVLSVTTPVAVSYNAEYSHRVGMQISGGGFPTFNQTYTWQPSSGATTGIDNRDIVTQVSCNNCHGKLALHGGGRTDTQYCVTCHNPGTSDAGSGNTVDFKVLIHKIHRGGNLHGEYGLWGRNGKKDWTDVVFPQDIRNCTNCHDEDNSATPQAANWFMQPTMEACTSCHDNLDFTLAGTEPNGHPGGPQADNALCSQCHGPNGGYPVKDNHSGHLANQQLGADKLVITIDSATLDAGNNLDVGLTMMLDGTPVEYSSIRKYINNGIELTDGDGYLMINYDDGTGYQFTYSSPATFFATTNGIHLSDCVYDGAGKHTCTRPNKPTASFGSTGTIAITFFEMPLCVNEKASNGALIDCATAEDSNTRLAAKAFDAPRKYFNIDGSEATDYVEKFGADRDSCNGCHQSLEVHSELNDAINIHAAIDFNQCTSCHNATRVSFYGGRPGDLKSHVHTLHSNSDSSHPLHGTYPNDISNCNACHSEDQIDLPIKMNTRASAAPSGGDDVYTSATAVVCSSCHINVPVGYIDPTAPGYLNAAAPDTVSLSSTEQSLVTHMLTNGAVFGSTTFETANIVEACAVCHAAGKDKGIDKVHNIL